MARQKSARYKSTLIGNPAYYANTFRHFYQNPLRAGVCQDVDQYEWSTRSSRTTICVSPCPSLESFIPSDPVTLKGWLNRIPPGPYQLMMQKALRRSEFKFPPHPTMKRAIDELSF